MTHISQISPGDLIAGKTNRIVKVLEITACLSMPEKQRWELFVQFIDDYTTTVFYIPQSAVVKLIGRETPGLRYPKNYRWKQTGEWNEGMFRRQRDRRVF